MESNIIINVAPEELRRAAQNFGDENTNITNLMNEMMDIVDNTSAFWTGEAHNAYANKFGQLRTDMNNMKTKIDKYVSNITEIAQNYDTAESGNVSESGKLKTSYIN